MIPEWIYGKPIWWFHYMGKAYIQFQEKIWCKMAGQAI
jgi:hypothetical protein